MQQEEATCHDDPATICVTGAVAVVVFIEREEAWEAATAFWSENKRNEGKGAWRVGCGGNSSDGEESASSPTDDGSSEEVIAMSQRTKHVHKKKRSKLKRNDSGPKTFPTSCCSVASGRGSLKRVQHLKTLKIMNKARLPLASFIGLSDFHVIKLLFVLIGVNSRTRLADFHMADKNEFRLTMRNFYRLRVERGMIQLIERIQPENEKLTAE